MTMPPSMTELNMSANSSSGFSIIEKITNVFGRMRGDEFAEGTWVVINELDDGNWGEGGTVLNKGFVPRVIALPTYSPIESPPRAAFRIAVNIH